MPLGDLIIHGPGGGELLRFRFNEEDGELIVRTTEDERSHVIICGRKEALEVRDWLALRMRGWSR